MDDHDSPHDDLSDFDQGVVGKVCRIEIPLKSPTALLQVADLLRGLANECEWAAKSKDGSPRQRMFQLMMHARNTNRQFRRIRGRGRPPSEIRRVREL